MHADPTTTDATRSRHRPQRHRRSVAAAVALAAATAALLAAPAAASAAPAPTAPVPAAHTAVASGASLASEAAAARARLAVTGRQHHPGTPERLAHPAADGLSAGYGAATTAAGTPRSYAATSPSLSGPTSTLGVDVADYQANVNWSALASAGVQFAYVKATEGTYYYDSAYFPEQYNGSYDAGLVRGAYHFAVPDDSSGAAQADYFVANGGGWSADGRTLPGMLDMEYNPYGPECYGLSEVQMADWVGAFDAEYEKLTGRYPALYTNADWWDTCTGGSSVASNDPLDVAAWGPSPSPLPAGWSSETVWQYTQSNSFGYDGDAFGGTRTSLDAFATGPSTAAAPVVTNEMGDGVSLHGGQQIVSDDGRFKVVMQRDGNFVEYAGTRALWDSRTENHAGAWAIMQGDGNLVVYTAADHPLWWSHTAGRGPSEAIIQDDANFVVYTVAAHTPTWASGANRWA
jgi:GH25 family lysozyme M1 (1,4-beta-N-acetylmuramidase)